MTNITDRLFANHGGFDGYTPAPSVDFHQDMSVLEAYPHPVDSVLSVATEYDRDGTLRVAVTDLLGGVSIYLTRAQTDQLIDVLLDANRGYTGQ